MDNAYEKALARADEIIQEAKVQRTMLGYVSGDLTYSEFRELPKRLQKRYTQTWGRPKSPTEVATEASRAQKAKKRKKAARKSRRANLKKRK